MVTAPTSEAMDSTSIVADTVPSLSLPISVKSAKHSHWHTSSTLSISPQSPPPKRVLAFTSPDWNELREALKARGAMEFDIE